MIPDKVRHTHPRILFDLSLILMFRRSLLRCPTFEFTGLRGFSRRSGGMMGWASGAKWHFYFSDCCLSKDILTRLHSQEEIIGICGSKLPPAVVHRKTF
jgi:hypothetical protein